MEGELFDRRFQICLGKNNRLLSCDQENVQIDDVDMLNHKY